MNRTVNPNNAPIGESFSSKSQHAQQRHAPDSEGEIYGIGQREESGPESKIIHVRSSPCAMRSSFDILQMHVCTTTRASAMQNWMVQ